jgi:Secretion system C-terminal sorting domain
MKSLTFLIVIYLCGSLVGSAQINYVVNPSFEQYQECPYGVDQITFATGWQSLDTVDTWENACIHGYCCLPEYCNACDSGYGVGVPWGDWYYQYPRTGNGMAQNTMCDVDSSIEGFQRDYTQGHLYKMLTAGKQYCVTFYVSREKDCAFAVNHIGAYLDNGAIDGVHSCGAIAETGYTPQIVEDSIISDTMYWTKVQGTFTARGGERFITIGNFFDNAHTDTLRVPGYWSTYLSLYLIDDVSVLPSDNVPFAGNDTSIAKGDSAFLGPDEIALPYTWYKLGDTEAIDSGGGIWVHPDSTTAYVLEQNLCGMYAYDTVTVSVTDTKTWVANVSRTARVSVYPNPNSGSFTLLQQVADNTVAHVQVLNAAGAAVYKGQLSFGGGMATLSLGNVPPGLYLLQMRDAHGNSFTVKFVVNP